MQNPRLRPICSGVFSPKRRTHGEDNYPSRADPPPAHQGGSPRNSSSVRRFLCVSRKESSPSRSAVEPRDTMSKRMGRLKTLRMGGGWGAGALGLCGCFLGGGKKDTRSLASACPALPDLSHGLGENETSGTKLKNTVECFTQEGEASLLCVGQKIKGKLPIL